jgi:hypothetical protein
MKEILIGGLAAFGALVLNKAVLEPLARNVGRRLIDLYVGPCCERLDYLIKSGLPDDFRRMGVEFSFEEQIRDFLDMAPEGLSDEDVQRIVAEVFKVYDIRLIK